MDRRLAEEVCLDDGWNGTMCRELSGQKLISAANELINGNPDLAQRHTNRLLRQRIKELELILRAIVGDAPWPDADMGYVDLARHALAVSPTPKEPKS